MSFVSRKTKEELRRALNRSYLRLKYFCDSNRLKLNGSKTHFLEILSSQNIKEIQLGEDLIEASEEERVLGIQVSNKLCGWRHQVDHVLSSCAKKMAALRLGGKHFPFKRRLATARAVHLSKLYYGIEAWGPGLSKGQVKTLQACQNKVLSWVVNKKGERTGQNLLECNLSR